MKKAERDANEPLIVSELRARGHLVQPLAQGDGVPDLLVAVDGVGPLVLLEVKDGAKIPSKQRLTPAQEHWHRRWRATPLHIVKTIDEAVSAVEKHRNNAQVAA